MRIVNHVTFLPYGLSDECLSTQVGELDDTKAFILDFTWPEAYPESAPQISLVAFFNNRM